MVPFLIVEDDPPVARSIARMLGPYASLTFVASVRDASAQLEARSWGGLMVDIGLPDGSGFDVIEHARGRGEQAPALVLTGRVEHAIINRAATLGARFVCKPCGKEEILPFVVDSVARAEGRTRDSFAQIAQRAATRWEFSPRETEIFQFALTGRTRSEYLDATGMSANTYKTHVRSLLDKCDYGSLASLALDMLRVGSA